MNRRQYLVVLVGLIVSGALSWWAFGQVWIVEDVAADGFLPAQVREFTGGDISPIGGFSFIIAFAGIAGLVATKRVGRIIVGVVLLAVGIASLVSVGARVADSGYAVIADIALVLMSVCGVVAILRGGTWPVLSNRYERADRRTDDAWDMLDRGEDPTV